MIHPSVFTKYIFLNFLLYRLKYIPLNKFNYKKKFNIIYDIGIKYNFDVNPIKKFIKKLKKNELILIIYHQIKSN